MHETDKPLHYVLVCHTELGLDGTWDVYNEIQPAFEGMIERVAQQTGQLPKVTYCLTNEIITSLGFPAPQTHVSGMFSFQQSTIEILKNAGFATDCSLIPNGRRIRHPATGDFVIADNRRRTDRRPYFPDPADPWTEGNCSLLEIPVSGNLGEAYFEMDWASSLTLGNMKHAITYF